MAKPTLRKTMKKISPPAVKSVKTETKSWSQNWFLGLIKEINDPESKLEEDDQIIVIKDKYPKARFHYLVLPKKDIPEISKVTRNDLTLLNHMENIAMKFVERHKEYEFLVGYHAIPSMHRLHLHVISTDFDSPSLKTKRHWNAFNTPYFILSKDVRKQVEEFGEMKINTKVNEAYLKRNLQCHKCPHISKTIPELKRHLLQHFPD